MNILKTGNYPVISISFRNYDEENWDDGLKTIKGILKEYILNINF